ncbi:MAG TPA: IPT/TIG domain-containing protein [Verrucomicrobiae bacterium]|jgi:hypothetical protein|nr:IPT/TIG domain-containing protein [Verrucomicrobiae bacterium]
MKHFKKLFLLASLCASVSALAQPHIDFFNPPFLPTAVNPNGGITLNGSGFGFVPDVRTTNGTPLHVYDWSDQIIEFAPPAGVGSFDFVISNSSSGQTVSGSIPYFPPNILSVSPTLIGAGGGTLLTIVGQYFGTNATVVIGGIDCSIVSETVDEAANYTIVCQAPAWGQGQHGAQDLLVEAGGQFSANLVSMTYGAPVITGFSPSNGPSAGNILLTLTGTDFGLAPMVQFHGTSCTVYSNTDTTIYLKLPAGAGTEDVTVAAAQVSAAASYTYAPPSVTSVSPSGLPTSGGATMTIAGTNFGSFGLATVNSNAVVPLLWTDTSITGYSPAGEGLGNQLVVMAQGVASLPHLVDYLPPTIASVIPSSLPAGGNGVLTISGTNFGAAPTVTVGGASCAVVSVTASNIVCRTPPGSGRLAPVVVTASKQTASTTVDFLAPLILSVTPAEMGAGGGTVVSITGTNFGLAQPSVSIGPTPCQVTAWNDTNVICVAPAGIGQFLTLTLNAGNQVASVMINYAAPLLSSLLPAGGSPTGGTVVTLTGTNFGSTGTVMIGGAPATTLHWTNTSIIVQTPAGSGGRQVVVNRVDQTSNPLLFTYLNPSAASVSPTNGPVMGETVITIAGTNFGTGGAVMIGGKAAGITSWTDALIVCVSPRGSGTNQAITVALPGSPTLTAGYFNYYPPAISGLSATNFPTAGGTWVTISGANFGGVTGVVSMGGKLCTISNWTDSAIVCQVPPGQGIFQPAVVVSGDAVTPPIYFSYLPPTISSITPTNGPSSGGTVVTLRGANFGAYGCALIGTATNGIINWSDSKIDFLTSGGLGSNLPVQVEVSQQTSPAALFTYEPPLLCAPGTYSANGFQPGVLAPPGYFVPVAGATGPTPAPPGYFAPTFGGTNAIPALAGMFAPTTNMSQPLLAWPGYYTPSNGAAAMFPAPPGAVVPFSGATNAFPVLAGYYAPTYAMSAGLAAPPGFYVPSNGLTAPAAADPGSFAAGFGSTNQTPAPAGQFAPFPGMASPIVAPPGYFVAATGSSNMVAAPAGTIVTNSGASLPQAATPGYYAPVAGMSAAIAAPPGYYVPVAGGTNLTAAPPGYFVSGFAQPLATPATAGQYVPCSNMSQALLTLPGYYTTNSGAMSQIPAAPGTFVSLMGQTNSQPVPRGFYAPFSGMSFGIPAEPGYYVPTNGALASIPASPGAIVTNAHATNQILVPPGYYAPGSNMSMAIAAAPGYYVASSGATNMTAATPGFVASGYSATTPVPTATGQFAPAPNMSQAILAEPGYYVPLTGASNMTAASPGSFVSLAGAMNQTPAPPGMTAPIAGMRAAIYVGDGNGDGIVSGQELASTLNNYWPNSAWIGLTNFATLGRGIFQFSLTNYIAPNFHVDVSSNVGASWEPLGIAYPVYQFIDPITNAPQRTYRLVWP